MKEIFRTPHLPAGATHTQLQAAITKWAVTDLRLLALSIPPKIIDGRVSGWPDLTLCGPGGLLIVLSLGVLFAWTFPADLATEIRTRMPADRRARRRRWEHPRAANARLVFLALCPAVLSVVLDDAREGDGDRA